MDVVGRMREQISIIQKSGTTRDDSGAIIPTDTTIGPIWAAVEFRTTSDERHLADQQTAITAVNFTIRNSPDRTITERDEITYRGKLYAIRSVLDKDPTRCFLLIETEQLGENYT